MRRWNGRLIRMGLSFLLVIVMFVGMVPAAAENTDAGTSGDVGDVGDVGDPVEGGETAGTEAGEDLNSDAPGDTGTGSEGSPWDGMDNAEFAAWLMDEANADTVKNILQSGSGAEYDALNARVGAILNGGDATLVQQVEEYLDALMDAGDPEPTSEVSGYICFDLALGSVEIGANSYKGYVNVGGTSTPIDVKTRTGEEKFYIYQSDPKAAADSPTNSNNTGYEYANDFDATTGAGQNCRIPTYKRVEYNGESWTEYITNNSKVEDVSNAWETAATDAGRKPLGTQGKRGSATTAKGENGTGNRIIFTGESGYTADVTIDNIWTYYQDVHNQGRTTGGITANLFNQRGTKIYIHLKGDNRVGNVYYNTPYNVNVENSSGNEIIFSNGEDEGQPQGSITVADFPGHFGANYWCAAIGGNDNGNHGHAEGIVIKGGVIYSGTTSWDDCTAIGGGGNEFGGVTIEGGTVTAVSASTGSAIGGGIGWSEKAGGANIKISGGHVYAYNHGIGPDSGSYVSFVPAAAIGGGSTSTNTADVKTDVTISGGFVYAQSVAGAAIGGGSSGKNTGGDATITISGGTIIAKSIGGKVYYNKDNNKNHSETVDPGVSIGGGTGGTSMKYNGKDVTGGSVILKISQASTATILRTGSIGGGQVNNGTGKIGYADVEITGGDIIGQVVMAKSADEGNCSFTMSGGTIHDTTVNAAEGIDIPGGVEDPNSDAKLQYIRHDGGAVWMEDPAGVAHISGNAVIKDCIADNGGAVYMEGGTFTMIGGTITGNTAGQEKGNPTGLGGGVCVYGGEVRMNGKTSTISSNHAKDGGGVYVDAGNVTIVNGKIDSNKAANNGGGICIVASKRGTDLAVKMVSGSLSSNTAVNSGGGMAVEGDGSHKVTVEIGCMLDHNLTNPPTPENPGEPTELPKPQLPIEYVNGAGGAAYAYEYCKNYCGVESKHESCPAVTNNSAEQIGGAIHIDCDSATLKLYCMNESGNKTGNDPEGTPEDELTPVIQVDGGTVDVGDEVYHNDLYNEEHGADDHEYTLTTARGYISIQNNVLVQAGKVNVYGSLTNPKMDHIVAKIEVTDNDLFIDHRFSRDTDVYWLRYSENFKNGTGFVSYDYSVFDKITVKDAPATHDGYIFRGWCAQSKYESGLKLYQPDEEILKSTIEQVYQEQDEAIYCDKCEEYIQGRLKVLYGIWEREYTLKTDETVRNVLGPAWEITYYKNEWVPEKNKFVLGEELFDLRDKTDETDEMLSGSKVIFEPQGSSYLPLTLTFEDDDTHDKFVDSLEHLAKISGGKDITVGAINDNGDSGFTVNVKFEDGVYTLIMPARHVTVSSVWELYLDNGTIDLYEGGFRQQDYLPYHKSDLWLELNEWGGDYRIWQCPDNNTDDQLHKEFHSTKDGLKEIFDKNGNKVPNGHIVPKSDAVLWLNGDLTKRYDGENLTNETRTISLGNLNIAADHSIALKGTAKAILTQTGRLEAQNIVVPHETTLTLEGLYNGTPDEKKAITLTPGAGHAGIGHGLKVKNGESEVIDPGGTIMANNCEIRVKAKSPEAKAIDSDTVYLTGCKMAAEIKQGASIHAQSLLRITSSEIDQ